MKTLFDLTRASAIPQIMGIHTAPRTRSRNKQKDRPKYFPKHNPYIFACYLCPNHILLARIAPSSRSIP